MRSTQLGVALSAAGHRSAEVGQLLEGTRAGSKKKLHALSQQLKSAAKEHPGVGRSHASSAAVTTPPRACELTA
jgi:hypothetical protein